MRCALRPVLEAVKRFRAALSVSLIVNAGEKKRRQKVAVTQGKLKCHAGEAFRVNEDAFEKQMHLTNEANMDAARTALVMARTVVS